MRLRTVRGGLFQRHGIELNPVVFVHVLCFHIAADDSR